MRPTLDLYIFVDAFGWEFAERYHFCEDIFPFRYCVTTQLGYSAGAVPTILTGKSPEEHGHFSFFYYDPVHSPFRWMRFFPSWLFPDFLFSRHRVRHHISKLLKKVLGYTGYFELYRVPFRHLGVLNYSEKKDLFIPGGLSPIANLADAWSNREHLISNWRKSGVFNFQEMESAVREERIECGFLYTAEFDGFMHRHVSDSDAVQKELVSLETKIRSLWNTAKEHYENVNLCVISDHGMTPLTQTLDVGAALASFRWGRDYVSCLDSTMARFWWINPEKKEAVMQAVASLGFGHWMTPEELTKFHVDFGNSRYGDSIYLLDAGAQIVPSDMGNAPLPGMHGFSPDDFHSDASFLSTRKPPFPPRWIGDFYKLMTAQGVEK